MGNLEFPSNPTSYRRTGWQIFLMFLMGVNYLMDNNPRHVQYKKALKARRQAEKYHYKPGFVTELPDDYDDYVDEHAYNPPPAYAPYPPPPPPPPPRPVQPSYPPCPSPPPVGPEGKERWPYAPRYSYEVRDERYRDRPRRAPKTASKTQMRDAWTRMRAVTRMPYEYVKRTDKRKRRVTFDRDVQWHFFEDDESYDGDTEEDMITRR